MILKDNMMVESLTFEPLMGFGGDDILPSLDMLDHSDTVEPTSATNTVSEYS